MRRTPRNSLWVLTLLAVAASIVAAPAAQAVPTGITFDRFSPSDGNTFLAARTAADDPLDPPTFQVKTDIYLDNSSGTDRDVTSVTISYPGSGIASRNYPPLRFWAGAKDTAEMGDQCENAMDDDGDDVNNDGCPPSPYVIPASGEGRLPIHDGLERDLPTPAPSTVRIEIFFDGDPVPLELNFDLALHDNAVPHGAYFFPAKASDLEAGELWAWGTRHTVDSGGGVGTINPSARTQRYALDMDVVRWTGSAWTSLKAGETGDENSDFLGFGEQLYAMADGVIVECYRGEADHAPGGFDEITFENNFGNSVFIDHGDELSSYGHFKDGSIPLELCPADGANSGLSIPVEAGQFLGQMGNTGRSTGPHLHWQIEGLPKTSTVEGLPMQFLNVRALADETTIQNLGGTPNLRPLHGMTLHKHSLVLPNPCGLDDLPGTGGIEVARHGIPAECYQDVFNQITSRGYRPVWVDGYEVDGDNFFNATFRPAGPASITRHGLTGAEYQDLFDDLTDDGYRLHQVDTYPQNGGVRYAAIFEQRSGPHFAAFHHLSDAEYATELATLSEAGFVAVNLSTVELGGQFFWTGLFEKVPVTGWTVETVPHANYQATFDANVDAGRIPIYVHGFSTGAGPYLTGIWVDPIGGSTQAGHGLTGAEYQSAFNSNLSAGRFTRAVTGYDNGNGSPRFAAVWRGAPNTSITSTPPAVTNQTSATFAFAGNNPFTTTECRLSPAAFSACTSPKTLTGLGEGTHTFFTRAVDRELIRDASPASFSWLVDLTPPDAEIVLPAEDTKTVHGELKEDEEVEQTTVVGWATVTAEVTDALAGVDTVAFEVNGVPVPAADVTHTPGSDEWSFLFKPDQNGEHQYTIEVIATDLANNVGTDTLQVTGVKTGKKA